MKDQSLDYDLKVLIHIGLFKADDRCILIIVKRDLNLNVFEASILSKNNVISFHSLQPFIQG